MARISVSDWRIYRLIPPGYGSIALVQEMTDELRGLGATFFRVMTFGHHPVVALEGWRTEPADQGPELRLEDFIGFGT